MTTKELTQLNDRLADVLICAKGFKLGLFSIPSGNKEAKEALDEYTTYIQDNLMTSKRIVQDNLTTSSK